MDLDSFLNLSTLEVARLVRREGPKVCVFPINGTRRWFILEHQANSVGSSGDAYLDIMSRRHVELYQLFFDHGIDTLLTPIFGPDLLERGEDYVSMAAEGMARLGSHADFLDFYRDYDVRVAFYGDYRRFLDPTPHGYLSETFAETAEMTRSHHQHRLFFGVFAHDATQTVAELSIDYYEEHGRVPDKRALVRLYYGDEVAPVDLFIGFDKFSAFDMPLVSTGQEDLYFTVAPSPYLTESQLRVILHDHLYVRPEPQTDYTELGSEDWTAMRRFYRANVGNTQGVGARLNQGGFWYPLPQVDLPEELRQC